MNAAPAIWAVSDGRAGIERQSLSLARALDCGEIRTVRLQPDGYQTNLPPTLWPAPLSALGADQRAQLAAPWPDIWIASGRRSIPYSILARKRSRGRTLVVQTQDPKISAAHFDLVIPPEHDGFTGPNVFPILGPPTWWSPAEIEAARKRFPEITEPAGEKVLVAIGGNSKTHRLTAQRASEIEAILRQIVASGFRLWITVSRRTPEIIALRLRLVALELRAQFWENEEVDGPNPYLAWLSLCDAALVTEDSANMLADPAFFGKPIHLLRLEGASPRFDKLHQGFIARGAARWWNGNIERWNYEPVREAARAAAEILRLWNERKAGQSA